MMEWVIRGLEEVLILSGKGLVGVAEHFPVYKAWGILPDDYRNFLVAHPMGTAVFAAAVLFLGIRIAKAH